MNAYIVTVEEVHTQRIKIFANNEFEAMGRVADGEGEEEESEYGYTLDSDTWQVEKVGEKCDGCEGKGITTAGFDNMTKPCPQCAGNGIEDPSKYKHDPDGPDTSIEAPTNIIQKESLDFSQIFTKGAGRSEIKKGK